MIGTIGTTGGSAAIGGPKLVEIDQERRRLFTAVTVGHLGIDVFNSMVPVVVVYLSVGLGMTAAQIGLAIGLHQFLAGATQPGFGFLVDRVGSRVLGPLSVAWAVAFLCLAVWLAQVSGSYALLIAGLALAALGSGAFHPQGTLHAGRAVAGREATSTSLFFLAGQLGLATGPILAGLLLDRRGPSALLQLGCLAMLLPLWMAARMSRNRVENERADPTAASAAPLRQPAWPLTVSLMAVFSLRGWLFIGTAAFLPLVCAQRGWSATTGGLAVGLFWMGGALGGVAAGWAADRFDHRVMIAAPTLAGGVLLAGIDAASTVPSAFLWALGCGALLGAPHSILIVLAQDGLPVRRGLASGLALGYLFASGAVASWGIGWLADRSQLVDVLAAGWLAALGVVLLTPLLCLPAGADTSQAAVGERA